MIITAIIIYCSWINFSFPISDSKRLWNILPEIRSFFLMSFLSLMHNFILNISKVFLKFLLFSFFENSLNFIIINEVFETISLGTHSLNGFNSKIKLVTFYTFIHCNLIVMKQIILCVTDETFLIQFRIIENNWNCAINNKPL